MEKKKNHCSEYIKADDLFISCCSVLAPLRIPLLIRYSLTSCLGQRFREEFLFLNFHFHLLHPFYTGPQWLYLIYLPLCRGYLDFS